MHDEACPGFADMVDQTTLGHRMLLQEFNVTPRTTWQIGTLCGALMYTRGYCFLPLGMPPHACRPVLTFFHRSSPSSAPHLQTPSATRPSRRA